MRVPAGDESTVVFPDGALVFIAKDEVDVIAVTVREALESWDRFGDAPNG